MAVFFLSFSSTLPLALLTGTIQAWYTTAGASLMVIGSLSLLQYAYLIKFLWAPFMDRYSPFNLNWRGWILITQIALAATLTMLAFMDPSRHPWGMFWLAAWIAFISASQDIAIDAYRVNVLRSEERGLGAAVTSVGGRLAMLAGGSLALILAANYGWRLTYICMAFLMLVQIIFTLKTNVLHKKPLIPVTFKNIMIAPFKELLTRKYFGMTLILVLIYKFGDALALSLNTTFLMRGVGFTLLELGYTYKLVSVIAALLGGFAGGFIMPYLGLYRSLLIFGFLQTIMNLSFMILALIGKKITFMIVAVFLDYFCGGLATIAFVAFLISLCSQRYSATQYAVFSALMAVPRVMIGPLAAFLVKHMGWAPFYLVAFFTGFPGLFVLWWLRDRINFNTVTLNPKTC